jgi:hypothetical protein
MGVTICDDAGQARIDLDVGTGSEMVELLLGSAGSESSGDIAWRWLGGRRDTVIAVPSLPDAGEIVISGLPLAKMDGALDFHAVQRRFSPFARGCSTDGGRSSFSTFFLRLESKGLARIGGSVRVRRLR